MNSWPRGDVGHPFQEAFFGESAGLIGELVARFFRSIDQRINIFFSEFTHGDKNIEVTIAVFETFKLSTKNKVIGIAAANNQYNLAFPTHVGE